VVRISSSKIKIIAEDIDGKIVGGIKYELDGPVKGIAAIFKHDSDDEELAGSTIKKYIKSNYPVLRVYVEVI